MSGTLFVCETVDDYNRHANLGRRAVLQSEFENGSFIEASRIVLTGSDTGSIRQFIAERYGDGVRVVSESKLQPVRVRPLSEIEPEAVEWLWPGFIAARKLTIISGDPGAGKTWVMLDVAARLTRGDAMPDGTGGGEPAGVLYITYDDGLADTLRVRLMALGADPKRILASDGNLDGGGESRHIPPEAIENILIKAEDAERRMGCPIRMVVLDPLSAALGGVDQNQSNAIYEKLGPLVTHCEAAGMSLVCLDHTGKGRPDRAINLAIGSQGKAGLARLMSVVVDSNDDDGSKLLLPSKNSLGPAVAGMRFLLEDAPIDQLIHDPDEASRIAGQLGSDTLCTLRWIEPVPMDAQKWLDEVREAMTGGAGTGLGSKGLEALRIVLECMSRGERIAGDIQRAVEEAGLSWRTAQHARKAIGIEINKSSFGWVWRFPGEDPKAALALVQRSSS